MIPTILQADTNINQAVPTKVEYQVLANQISAQYQVKASTVKRIINCESNWNTNAIRSTSREYSVGLSQINLRAHKDITIAEAKDPEFAITYLASNLANGNASMWSCSK